MKKMIFRDILILGVFAMLLAIVMLILPLILPIDPSFVGIMLGLIIILIRLDAIEKKIDNLGKQETSSCDCSGSATSNGSQQSENNSAATDLLQEIEAKK